MGRGQGPRSISADYIQFGARAPPPAPSSPPPPTLLACVCVCACLARPIARRPFFGGAPISSQPPSKSTATKWAASQPPLFPSSAFAPFARPPARLEPRRLGRCLTSTQMEPHGHHLRRRSLAVLSWPRACNFSKRFLLVHSSCKGAGRAARANTESGH